jgi:dihydrofolate reductase
MTRPRISAFVGVSLDGFLARRDGDVEWLKPYEQIDHGYQAFLESVDTLVVGRRTYDFVLSMLAAGLPWPYAGKSCVVMTHRPVDGLHGERAFAGEPLRLVQMLEPEGARHLYVDGGVVIREFLAQGLLDQLVVTVVPTLIGEGVPLFGGVRREAGLVFEAAVPFPDGAVQLRYRVLDPAGG